LVAVTVGGFEDGVAGAFTVGIWNGWFSACLFLSRAAAAASTVGNVSASGTA
jgi:hypothetical protein